MVIRNINFYVKLALTVGEEESAADKKQLNNCLNG